MLTTTSGINNLTGYQAQLDVSNTARPSNNSDPASSDREKTDDSVDISSKAKELQQAYQGEKSKLEQKHDSEAQQLEREYIQEKNRIEREYSRKKRSLEINVYA